MMDSENEITRKPSRILITIMIITLIGVIISHFFKHSTQMQAIQSIALPQKTIAAKQNVQTKIISVASGDTLASILQNANLPNTIANQLSQLSVALPYLRQLQLNHTMTLQITPENTLQQLTYDIDDTKTLQITASNDHYVASVLKKPLTETVQFKSSVIHHSLDQAAISAGLTKKMLTQLNTMFARSPIAHQLHPGAHLYVLYHEYFVNDKKDHPGNIIAAEIVNGQQHYQLVRFIAPNHQSGYYTPTGHTVSEKPTFLSAPLHYTRVTSKFSYHRMDPVLHRVHPHLGVDYAAPSGTPIRAIGNCVVLFSKRFGGYGNAIMIRYNNTYKTLYGHLEKFAQNVHPFQHVKKGQIVGYVGETGWATGPHLHYEILKNNKPVNPLTIQFPHTQSIPEKYRHLFYNETDHRLAQLNLYINATKTQK